MFCCCVFDDGLVIGDVCVVSRGSGVLSGVDVGDSSVDGGEVMVVVGLLVVLFVVEVLMAVLGVFS